MAKTSSQSVIVVGGGIVGLTTAVVLQAHGHKVIVVARDPLPATASGVAAGMLAPALEAMSDSDPAQAFARLSHAAGHWHSLGGDVPEVVRRYLPIAFAKRNWLLADAAVPETLNATGAKVTRVPGATSRHADISAHLTPHAVGGEGLFSATWLLGALYQAFVDGGGDWRADDVHTVRADSVWCSSIGWIDADAVIIAAGYGSRSLRQQVPSLRHVSPIKGHILELQGHANWVGVMRAASGYQAQFADGGKFGATMEAGRDDSEIDALQVALLKDRARALFPGLALDRAVPRAGVRAASPDGWPMVGRDAHSGVLVATAMRRNGYIFAPLAARMMLDLIEDRVPPELALYDPNRFH